MNNKQEHFDEWLRSQIAEAPNEPVVGFDKDRLWQEALRPALHPQHKQRFWPWQLAAGMLVMVLLGLVYGLRSPEVTIEKTKKAYPNITPLQVQPLEKQRITKKQKTKVNRNIEEVTIALPENMASVDEEQVSIEKISPNVVESTLTMPEIRTVPYTPQKRWRMAHANELTSVQKNTETPLPKPKPPILESLKLGTSTSDKPVEYKPVVLSFQ